MFGLPSKRRTAVRLAPATPVATFEPLEGRRLLSGVAPSDVVAGTDGLTLAVTKSTLPLTSITGTPLKGNVTFTLTNSGTVTATGPETLGIFASTDTVVDGTTDTRLGSVTKNVTLAAGKTKTFTVPVRNAVPTGGNYFVLAQAANVAGVPSTTGQATGMLLVAPASNVLTATIGTPVPAALLMNKTVTFKATLTNTGNTAAKGTLTAAIELSADGINVFQTLTPIQKRAINVKPTRAVTLTFKAKVPVTGMYDIGAQFTFGTQTPFTAFSSTAITVLSTAR